jgi:hypothetical protein
MSSRKDVNEALVEGSAPKKRRLWRPLLGSLLLLGAAVVAAFWIKETPPPPEPSPPEPSQSASARPTDEVPLVSPSGDPPEPALLVDSGLVEVPPTSDASAGKPQPPPPKPTGDPDADELPRRTRAIVQSTLTNAANAAKSCGSDAGPKGEANVSVTISPSGAVDSVIIGAPFRGTQVGTCIEGIFRGIRLPPSPGTLQEGSAVIPFY